MKSTSLSFWLAGALACQTACLNVGGNPADGAGGGADGSSPATSGEGQPSSLGSTSSAATAPNTPSTPATTSPVPSSSSASTAPVVGQANPSVGAGAGAATSPNAPAPEVVTGIDRYTLVGRYDLTNPNALIMYYLSSKIGATFSGTSLAVNLADSGTDGLNIVLDGNALPPMQLKASGMTTYPLATGLSAGLHTVWITKRDEWSQAGNGYITFGGFVIDAGENFYTPPKPRPRRIEATGDSSSAGYGVECAWVLGQPGFSGSYTPQTQNADLSIPAVVAQNLDAEIYNVSWSGKAVVQSQFDSNPNHMLPITYPQFFANIPNTLWDFSRAPMDVVLISAGANDLIGSNGSGSFRDTDAFIKTYAQWLTFMRSKYPTATLVAIMSPNAKGTDRTKLTSALSAAVAMAAGPQQDPNMMFFDFFADDPNGWTVYDDVANKGGLAWGCNYHTSTAGSRWLGQRLTAAVKAHMKW